MTAARLLSAVEPIIRYQRGEGFRGAATATPGSVRYQFRTLQAREDALHRLVDVWATGEASASLAFAAARAFDELDPLEKEAQAILVSQGATGTRAQAKLLRQASEEAAMLLKLPVIDSRREKLQSDPLLRFLVLDSQADILCPAAKLWNTGWGAQMMREAVSLMGGYGITEDCPGYLGKQMDGRAAGSNLRGSRGGATPTTFHHDDSSGIFGAI